MEPAPIDANDRLLFFAHPESVKVAAAGEPIFESVSHLGDAPDHGLRQFVAAADSSTRRFSITTKYSLPRSTRMAEWSVGHPGVVLE